MYILKVKKLLKMVVYSIFIMEVKKHVVKELNNPKSTKHRKIIKAISNRLVITRNANGLNIPSLKINSDWIF